MATYTRKDFEESESTKQSKTAYEQHQAIKPGEYQASQYQQIADDALNKYMNRDKFSYDLNGDALYQQYKDKYIQQGKMAMMDTMGQAQAMTGGYGNSYAQSVGQQAYQAQLHNLNDVVPELYQLAYDRYHQEGQDMLNQYTLAADREGQEYSRYQDKVNQWNAENDRLYGQYVDGRAFDYGKYADEENFRYGQHIDDRNYQYQQERDAVSDAQFAEQMQYQREQDALAQENWQKEFDFAKEQYNDSLTGTSDDNTEFQKYIFSRVDDNGNYVFYKDGKEYTYAAGVNPYTGTTNPDTKNGTFSNGYQPNNVNGQKLSKSGITDVVNGVTQNVWQTPDGQQWI